MMTKKSVETEHSLRGRNIYLGFKSQRVESTKREREIGGGGKGEEEKKKKKKKDLSLLDQIRDGLRKVIDSIRK